MLMVAPGRNFCLSCLTALTNRRRSRAVRVFWLVRTRLASRGAGGGATQLPQVHPGPQSQDGPHPQSARAGAGTAQAPARATRIANQKWSLPGVTIGPSPKSRGEILDPSVPRPCPNSNPPPRAFFSTAFRRAGGVSPLLFSDSGG